MLGGVEEGENGDDGGGGSGEGGKGVEGGYGIMENMVVFKNVDLKLI